MTQKAAIKKLCFYLLGAACILTLSFGLFGCSGGNEKAEEIDRIEFAEVTKDNPAKAEQEYCNKPICITGKIQNIFSDSFSLYYFVDHDGEIDYQGGTYGVTITVRTDQNEIAKLNRKDIVKVTGTISRIYSNSIIHLDASSIEVLES